MMLERRSRAVRRASLALALLAALVPDPATAATRWEAKTRINLTENYDSNVLNRQNRQESDFYTAIVPDVPTGREPISHWLSVPITGDGTAETKLTLGS